MEQRSKFIAAGVVAVVLVGILFIVARHVDGVADRKRPMYRDTFTMAGLQWDLLKGDRPPVLAELDHDSSPVQVGEHQFRPESGVRIVVEERGNHVCVQGSNQYGDQTRWQCVDKKSPRPALGGLELDTPGS